MVIGRKGGPRTRQSTVVRALKEKIGKIKKKCLPLPAAVGWTLRKFLTCRGSAVLVLNGF